MALSLQCLGGAGTVTGSRHLLEGKSQRILVDCGLFQGLKAMRERNWAPFPTPPKSIGRVVLTHAHLDHSGYLPRLIRDGYRGEVLCTPATADLCRILLRDAAHLQEREAEQANRYGYSKHHPALPLYTVQEAERSLRALATQAAGVERDLGGGVHLRFARAGHILCAATARFRLEARTVVFSGDLGRYDDAVMLDPEPVRDADYLVLESTYGDRVHERTDPAEALFAVVERTIGRGGTVVIPAFAVGRAQQILHHLWRLKAAGRLGLVPIFLDSPMAIDAADLLARHADEHRLSEGACRATCAVAQYVRTVEGSKALSANAMPKIIISASGMASGGRVLHHIKAFGGDRRNTLLFTGFQAVGTRGAKLVAGAREIKMFGQWWPIRSEVVHLSMLSAHADAEEILRWLSAFEGPPRETFIVHGEPAASEALRDRISRQLGWRCTVAEPFRRYELAA